MDIFGIGLPELVVILALILIVVGPARLPEMAAQLARFIRAFRRYSSQVTKEFNETMSDLEKKYEDMQGEWKDVGQGLEEGAKSVTEELRSAGRETSDTLDEVKSAADETTKSTERPAGQA